MSDSTETVRVNFGAPIPLFPLSGVILLPHAVLPLHIFEDRYRQMVDDALDGPGLIAMGAFEGEQWKHEFHGNPPIRPAVCIGQILQHEKLPDGRFNVLLRGVCRAKIADHLLPDDAHLYRRVLVEPLETPPAHGADEDESLAHVRDRLRAWFATAPLTSLVAADNIETHLETGELPTSAILDLLAITVVTDLELKYRLLAEPTPERRAMMIENELVSLRSLLARAERQIDTEAPRGVSWN